MVCPTALEALGAAFPVALQCSEMCIRDRFRNVNHYDMDAPFLKNFFNVVKGAVLKLCTAILGEHAIHVLCKKKGGG